MNELAELIHIINKNKIKDIEVLGNPSSAKTLVQEFYEKISDGDIKTDSEAAAYFYNASSKDRRYKDLKRKLKERLFTTALFVDVNQAKYNEIGKAYYKCWKDFASAKVLAGKGAQLSAYKLMEKILKVSIRFGFTEIVIDLSRSLRLHYGSHLFDKKKFEHYHRLYEHYLEQYRAEALAEEYYARCQFNYYGIIEEKLPKAYEQAMIYTRELEPLVKKYRSYKISMLYFLIQYIALSNNRAYDKAIEVCEEAIAFFKSNPDFSKTAIGIFMRQLFLLYWQQKLYSKGEQLLKEAVTYTREGDISWFTNYGYFFLLCLHSQQYERAYQTIQEVMNHVRFKSVPEWEQQRWFVYRAYIIYLGEIGKIADVKSEKFRVQRFINDVPIFSKDKRNQNIPVLIVQILFLLRYQRYHEMIDRMEAIEKYCSRYLKKDDTYRSNCFIRMLLKIVEANFHKAGALRKAKILRKKLDETPFEAAKRVCEVEIIPYEDLWEFALESLEKKPRKK
jgi:hypothetical protein